MFRQTACIVAGLLAGLVVFEGLPALGWEFMEGHMGMWHVIWFVYPLVIVPIIVALVALAHQNPVPFKFSVMVAMSVLVPESLIIVYQEYHEFAAWGPPKSPWDAVIGIGTFTVLAFVAGIIAPFALRIIARVGGRMRSSG